MHDLVHAAVHDLETTGIEEKTLLCLKVNWCIFSRDKFCLAFEGVSRHINRGYPVDTVYFDF